MDSSIFCKVGIYRVDEEAGSAGDPVSKIKSRRRGAVIVLCETTWITWTHTRSGSESRERQ
jgi:hypothetical protein